MSVNGRALERPLETRSALLAAAREVFAEVGYAHTRTEDVVAKARVTRGALYHHFKNKEGLFREVFAEVRIAMIARIVRGGALDPDPSDDPWEAMRQAYHDYLDACLDPTFARIILVDGPAVLGQRDWAVAVERGFSPMRRWLNAMMADQMLDPLPIDALARILVMLIESASFYVVRVEDQARARGDVGLVIDRLLLGLRAGDRVLESAVAPVVPTQGHPVTKPVSVTSERAAHEAQDTAAIDGGYQPTTASGQEKLS